MSDSIKLPPAFHASAIAAVLAIQHTEYVGADVPQRIVVAGRPTMNAAIVNHNRTVPLPLLVALMLALMLIAGMGGTTRVGAQPVGPGIDGFSQTCRSLQDHANDLAAEYSRIGRDNPSDPRLDDILAELRSTGTTWQQIGCQGVFGNIFGAQLISAPRNGTPAPRPGSVPVYASGGNRESANG